MFLPSLPRLGDCEDGDDDDDGGGGGDTATAAARFLGTTFGDPLSSHTDVSFTPWLVYISSSNSSRTSPLMFTIVM